MKKICGNCLHYEECKRYVDYFESFPELKRGCSNFKRKESLLSIILGSAALIGLFFPFWVVLLVKVGDLGYTNGVVLTLFTACIDLLLWFLYVAVERGSK